MRTLYTIALLYCLHHIPAIAPGQSAGGTYKIVGLLKGLGSGKVILGNKPRGIPTGFKPVFYDSCVAREDSFFLTGQLPEPGLYSLEISGKKAWCWFLLNNDTLRINGHSDSIWKARITGSGDHEVYVNYLRTVEFGKTRKKLDSLETSLGAAASKVDSLAIQSAKDAVQQQLLTERMRYLSGYPSSFAVLYELSQLAVAIPIDSARKLFNGLAPALQAHSRGSKLRHQLFELDRSLAVGHPAPTFSLPDTTGKARTLSSYRGKYVLLDFWASWCGPCIEELPTIKKLDAQYRAKGLQVVSISLDHQKDRWLAAMKKHDIRWPSWSDLKGTENEVTTLYGIQSIPFKILIDPAGNLVLKNPSLEELATHLQKTM